MGLSSPSKKLESPSSSRDKYVDTRSLAEKGVNLIALLIAFPILAFSYPLSLLTRGTLHGVWNFSKEIRPPITQIWADFMTSNVMNVRFKIVSQKQLYRDGKCVYLCNHRAWADFFIDMYLTEGRAFIPVLHIDLRAHETVLELVCRLLLVKKNLSNSLLLT